MIIEEYRLGRKSTKIMLHRITQFNIDLFFKFDTYDHLGHFFPLVPGVIPTPSSTFLAFVFFLPSLLAYVLGVSASLIHNQLVSHRFLEAREHEHQLHQSFHSTLEFFELFSCCQHLRHTKQVL